MLVLAAVLGQTPCGLVLRDVVALLELLLEPGKPADVRSAVAKIGVAEASDLGLVLDRLQL